VCAKHELKVLRQMRTIAPVNTKIDVNVLQQMQTITPADLNDAYSLFGLDDDEVFSVIATAGPVAPNPPPRLRLQSEGSTRAPQAVSNQGQAPAGDVTNMLLASMAAALQKSFMESQSTGKQGDGASKGEADCGETGG
jgi:hypothetical protein